MTDIISPGVDAPFPVEERTVEKLSDLEYTNVEMLDLTLQGASDFVAPPQPFEEAVKSAQSHMLSHADDIIRPFVRKGWATKKQSRDFIAGAQVLQANVGAPVAGQTDPTWTPKQFDGNSSTNQLNIEDFFATLDFVPLPRNIRLELYEQQLFEENHIAGACIARIAGGVTKRGWEMGHFQEDNLAQEEGKQADGLDDTQEEADILEEWIDNVNSVTDFRQITEHTAACFESLSNAYVEVIREEFGDPASPPAGLETFIASTVRVIKGHRGFVQWLAGQFRWFNPYMPNLEDRQAGTQLWIEYWQGRGIDVEDPEFVNSPWCRTISSAMPDNVWNPYLTEVIHLKDLSLSSKYYGFPKDYRLGKLSALLQWSLDFNIALQRNNRIPPFVIYFHGKLTDESRTSIQQYFQSLKGADNWGKVPLLEAAPGSAVSHGGGQRAGIDIVKIAGEEKDGVFLELMREIVKHHAMHYKMPLDLLTTENSNRATIEVAEQLFNEDVINRFHEIWEGVLKKITHYDLGFENRYVKFKDLDIVDTLSQSTEAKSWHDMGALNPNEIRQKYLSLPERPGGDQYWEGFVAIEDEKGEEDQTAAGAEEENLPTSAKANSAANAAASNNAGQVQQSDVDAIWSRLMDRYGA